MPLTARRPHHAGRVELDELHVDQRLPRPAVRVRARASIETRLFIDGSYVDAAKGGRFATVDPATGEP